ncbi:hypothetical protein GA0070604_5099 [Micromonospora eburnea]|uniref:Uncharacterized protein n=1 Tax=Micromonospora eburnea TaxID=227316 RepID=A0A1C6VC85_9ACTN|nr:hypothetical protein GA0070604_5099 [Micromonospora eburnea]
MLFASVVTMVAFLVWLTVARLRWFTGVVLVVLTLVAAASLTLAAVQPRAAVEARLLLFLGVAVTLLVARVVQRAGSATAATTGRAGAGRTGSGSVWRWSSPSAASPQLHETSTTMGSYRRYRSWAGCRAGLPFGGTGSDSECGTGRCAVSYRLVGRPVEPADQVAQRMWDHLVGQGWPPPDGGRSCRPVGWLLDTRETCVAISAGKGVARLSLAGGRPYPRYNELR